MVPHKKLASNDELRLYVCVSWWVGLLLRPQLICVCWTVAEVKNVYIVC